MPDSFEATPSTPLLRDTLVRVGEWLRSTHYDFVTVTPATHACFLGRRGETAARDLRDIFGWNLPFHGSLLPRPVLQELRQAHLLEEVQPDWLRSRVRFASLANQLFPHSGFPTLDKETVFFGPDTYRFSALIQQELRALSLPRGAKILDVGCGTGAGGLVAAMQCADLDPQLTLTDISPVALEFARASTALSGLRNVSLHQGDLFNGLPPRYDLIVANPPYLNDESQRLYRHGGGRWGEAVSIRILQEGLPLLATAGRMILYTGSCIAGGVDHLRNALMPLLQSHHCQGRYEEIDPDVFGEELQRPAYSDVERIAVVAVVVRKS